MYKIGYKGLLYLVTTTRYASTSSRKEILHILQDPLEESKETTHAGYERIPVTIREKVLLPDPAKDIFDHAKIYDACQGLCATAETMEMLTAFEDTSLTL